MLELWTPTHTPPQVSEEARAAVLSLVLEEGVTPVTNSALSTLQTGYEPLGEYLDRFGYDLNQISAEGLWPERVLKMGASLALLAYHETGYFQEIDETVFEHGSMFAIIQGIPEAYLTSVHDDLGLVHIVESVAEAPDLHEVGGGFQQVLTIGAGCTRFYMQQALAA